MIFNKIPHLKVSEIPKISKMLDFETPKFPIWFHVKNEKVKLWTMICEQVSRMEKSRYFSM